VLSGGRGDGDECHRHRPRLTERGGDGMGVADITVTDIITVTDATVTTVF